MSVAKVPWYLEPIESDHNIFYRKKYPNDPTKETEIFPVYTFSLFEAITEHFTKLDRCT